jgi:alanine-glyoxylate transaminase / serine-glyoxylate transaminase / serine-pyruvate transaminase
MRQVGHLDPAFLTIMNELQDLLRYAFQTSHSVTIPVSGCGSAAMEATFANLLEKDDTILIPTAGYFALRMADMSSRYGANVVTIDKPWGSYFTLEELEAALIEHKPKILALVHADTSTGCLQPLAGVGKLCRDHNCLLLCDAVTSLGGLPLFVDEWGIDACYSGSQKCLSCPPGISPLTMSPRAMKVIGERKTKVSNWYLDLSMVGKYWGKERTYHHTAPINMNYALRESLRLVSEEGLEQRWRRHRENSALLWKGLKDIGLEPFIEDERVRLPSLNAVRVPDGVDPKQVSAYMLQHYNIEIGAGLGELKGKIWRVGLMGYNSRPENVALCIVALRDAIATTTAADADAAAAGSIQEESSLAGVKFSASKTCLFEEMVRALPESDGINIHQWLYDGTAMTEAWNNVAGEDATFVKVDAVPKFVDYMWNAFKTKIEPHASLAGPTMLLHMLQSNELLMHVAVDAQHETHTSWLLSNDDELILKHVFTTKFPALIIQHFADVYSRECSM